MSLDDGRTLYDTSDDHRLSTIAHTSRHTPIEAPRAHNAAAEAHAAEILAGLTSTQREVLTMRAMAGMRHRDIGRILWPEVQPHLATVRSENTYSRTRAKVLSSYAAQPAEVRAQLDDDEIARVLVAVLRNGRPR